MADTLNPDLCVIGAGETGITLAIRARQRGLDVVLIDLGTPPPGDASRADLRRQALLATAQQAQAIRLAPRLGLEAADPKPNYRTISEHTAAVGESAAPRDSHERLAALNVNVLVGEASFVDRSTLNLGETRIRARHFALTTGAEPIVPKLTGLDQVSYFTPDTILDAVRKLSHLVVIGGTAEAFELAQAYRRLGSDVTLVTHGAMLPGLDPELTAILLRILREEGIAIIDALVTDIVPRTQGTGINIRRGEEAPEALDASHILLALGRTPAIPQAMLERARLKMAAGSPPRLDIAPDGRVGGSKISAIGGAGGEFRPHAVRRQVEALLARIGGGKGAQVEAAYLPHTLATDPPLAWVGTTGVSSRQKEVVLRIGLGGTDAALAGGYGEGSAKLILDSAGLVRGGGMVGRGAAEVIAILEWAISHRLRADDLAQLSLPSSSPAAILAELGYLYLAQKPAPGGKAPALRRLLG
jgi:pyruvate/2-oxoglutarate dehydrogenase complex dihydrolipoamide dehydrogenase (E3) component